MWDRRILKFGIISGLGLALTVAPVAQQPAQAGPRTALGIVGGAVLGAAVLGAMSQSHAARPQPRRKQAARPKAPRAPKTAKQAPARNTGATTNVANSNVDPFAQPASQSTAAASKQ
ncbi:hypothetical protein ACLBXM_23390 [Xanthobacteraceae bacterium A53D]